jgi:hypothetical protein
MQYQDHLQNVLLSGKLQKKVVVNNRRKTESPAAQLVMQSAYSKKLPIGDKKKADILNLLRKILHSQMICCYLWAPILINITFKVLLAIFVLCFSLNCDNVIINV